jgi:cyclic-di-AMP phosphodiesterase PgpH
MSWFGSRRNRNGRGVALRLSANSDDDLSSWLKDRAVIARLVLGLVSVAALVACVQGWKQSFPYRLGQRPVEGVTAAVGFQRVNRERTSRARDRASEQVPLVFRHDPRSLVRLPQEFRTALLALGPHEDIARVPAEVRRAFGLTLEASRTAPTGLPADDREQAFKRLREIATDEERLRVIVAEAAKFLEPLEQRGLLRPEHLPPEGSPGGQITVVTPDEESRIVNLSEVQIAQLLAPRGLLFERWAIFEPLQPIRPEFEHWLKAQSPETLTFLSAETQAARQEARDSEPEVADVYNAGNLLVKPSEAIDESQLELLQAHHEQLEKSQKLGDRLARIAIVFSMMLVLALLVGYYLVRNEPVLVGNFTRLSMYLGLIVVSVALGRGLSYDPWRAEIGPVLATVMVCAIAYNQVLATITAFCLSLIITVSTGADLGRFTVMMSVCATAAILLSSVPSRSTLVLVGVWSTIVCVLMYWGTVVIESPAGIVLWRDTGHWYHALRTAGWCLAAGFLVSGSLPFVESVFGAVTDISLLELGDVSHPLLQELVRRAPGTYNHSITVASIGETAADRIGANGLLVRVGAYFHDIGKVLKPHYFVENMTAGENRHEHLAPAMSTLIIIGHVKDGADLARQHNLPQALVDFVEQHHGTTLVEYFYHEAAKQADSQPDHRTDAEESSFRYPGPKPQSKESAILMLADAVEGASRTLSEPTPSRIERLVHDMALKRLLDGQFDESSLTLTELSRVEESLTKSLTAMYHGRVKYPEQRSA